MKLANLTVTIYGLNKYVLFMQLTYDKNSKRPINLSTLFLQVAKTYPVCTKNNNTILFFFIARNLLLEIGYLFFEELIMCRVLTK